jgi:hypothetical protein
MPRNVVTAGKLNRIEGVPEALAEIGRRLNRVKAQALKAKYVEAADIVTAEVRAKIAGMSASPELKRALTAAAVTNQGPDELANAVSRISQHAAIKALGTRDGRIPNPYWWEYGTVARAWKSGKSTGQIKPQPFFRPGVTAARAKVTAFLIQVFRDALGGSAQIPDAPAKAPSGPRRRDSRGRFI